MFSPAHLRAPGRDRAILTGTLVAIAGLAWLALWLWEGSPYGHYLHHDGVGVDTSVAVGAAAFTMGWTLMIVAMMLPSSVPLVVTFGALVARRARPAPAGRLAAPGLPPRLGRVRVRGLGRRPCRPRGGRCPAMAGGTPGADPGGDPPRGRPVAVQPVARPLPGRVPQPARLRAQPLARDIGAARGSDDRLCPRRILRRVVAGR